MSDKGIRPDSEAYRGGHWKTIIAGVVAAALMTLASAELRPAHAQTGDPAAKGSAAETAVEAIEQTAPAPISPPAEQRRPDRGSVTNLPIPRYVSLKGSEGNARRGPSLTHRVDWVFRHAGMPLRVTAEFGHWRRVEDRDGAGGWVHYALLSGVRTAIVLDDMTDLLARPDPQAQVVARAEAGVIGRLGACNPDWCQITAGGEKGWVRKTSLWGVDPDEIRE
ncbi:SH3 domain-containing protein [Paracoccus pacificus]|uniref:SH3 domain-containing protein n=1 Tax=Paracoccus pacificus TaxID=1463598 RepID=A0ABW4RA06_9RHOB